MMVWIITHIEIVGIILVTLLVAFVILQQRRTPQSTAAWVLFIVLVPYIAVPLFLGLGFLVMVGAAKLVTAGNSAAPYWLILTYLLHTMGELCVSPVGLSSVTKLAPKRFGSQMMGIWFLATALGNLIAGLMAGRFNPESLNDMPGLFLQIVLIAAGSGLLMLVFTKPIRRLMRNIK